MIRLILLLTAAAVPARACLEVAGDQIRASDLAAAVPAFRNVDAVLGYAPIPGAQRTFSAVEIRRHLERLRLPAEGVAEGVCVKRRLISYSREDFAAAIQASLGPGSGGIEILRFGPAEGPEGRLVFERRGLSPPARQSRVCIWKGRIRYSDRSSIPAWAEVRLLGTAEVLVTARDLAAGQSVSPEDLRVESRPTEPFQSTRPLTVDAAVGLLLKRSLRAGTALAAAHLMSPPEVRRGDRVRIEAQVGKAYLAIDGTAEAAGRTGDQIPVRSALNNRILKATVRAKGLVSALESQ